MIVEGVLSSLGALPTGAATAATSGALGVGGADGAGFADTLKRMVAAVESTNGQANQSVMAMTDGTGDVHDAMIALQKADMTLQLTMQIRNKLIGAYQEIMRMPV
jgi:flagellar hook-basal body complex protein FliE